MCIFNRKLFECFALWSRLLIFFCFCFNWCTVSYFSRALDVYVGLSMLGCMDVCGTVCTSVDFTLKCELCMWTEIHTVSQCKHILFYRMLFFAVCNRHITRATAAAAAAADEYHLYIEMYNFYLWNIDVCARFIFPFLIININLSIISFVRIYVEF